MLTSLSLVNTSFGGENLGERGCKIFIFILKFQFFFILNLMNVMQTNVAVSPLEEVDIFRSGDTDSDSVRRQLCAIIGEVGKLPNE